MQNNLPYNTSENSDNIIRLSLLILTETFHIIFASLTLPMDEFPLENFNSLELPFDDKNVFRIILILTLN